MENTQTVTSIDSSYKSKLKRAIIVNLGIFVLYNLFRVFVISTGLNKPIIQTAEQVANGIQTNPGFVETIFLMSGFHFWTLHILILTLITFLSFVIDLMRHNKKPGFVYAVTTGVIILVGLISIPLGFLESIF